MGQPPLGKHIKRLREVRKMTQECLAERSALAPDTIRRLEHEDFSPTLKTLPKVCAGLGISLSTLFGGLEAPSTDHPEYLELVSMLRDCDRPTLRLVTRVVRELVGVLKARGGLGGANTPKSN